MTGGEPALVLRGAALFDGTGRPPLVDAAVAIEGGRVVAAGPVGSIAVPPGARIVDLPAGRTITPGLIDLHVHSTFPSEMAVYLARGVTSIRFAGIDQAAFRVIQARVARQDPPGPRLFTLGPMLDREPPSWPEWSVVVDSPDAARSEGRRLLHDEETDGLVAVQGLRPDDLLAVVETAHEANRPVMGQLWRTDAREAAQAGIDQLDNTARIVASSTVHGDALFDYRSVPERLAILSRVWLSVDWDATEQLMQAMVERDTAYCPTLVVLEQQAGLHPEVLEADASFRTAFGEAEHRAWHAFVNRVSGTLGAADIANRTASLEARREWIRRFHAMGGRILVGTDMPFGGLAIHRELEILRECGISAAEVLASATGGAARAMRLSDRLGTIEPGRAADLLVVHGDPSVDLAALRRIDLVMRDGRAVSGPLADVLSAEPPR